MFLFSLSLILLCFSCFSFFKKRSLRYLRYYQQEEYNALRFLHWHWKNRAFDIKGSLILLFAAIAYLFGINFVVLVVFVSTILSLIPNFEEDPTKEGKIKLKMTERASRIYQRSLGIYGFSLFALTFLSLLILPASTWLVLLALFQATPLFLIMATLTLEPEERRLQARFLKEAKQILKDVSPFVIGITGSFGKTSTKHALAQILQVSLGPTFWPSKGVNTPMGITREIRSHLKEGHRYAVMEMGAYKKGSIARLCDLTPPDAAIITAIGNTHLGRFGSLENIRLGKSELAQAVPENGILVCNGDDEGCRWIANRYPKKHTLFYGFENSLADCWISSWRITPEGTRYQITWKGKPYSGLCPLFGKHALANVMAAWTLACTLGSDPEYVLAIIRSLTPVDNRLHFQQDGKISYLHDGYNSNPSGFSSALEVMSSLPAERRIIMTPGMIELGDMQYTENEKIGEKIGHVCNLAILVGDLNQKSLLKGLRKTGFKEEQIILCDSREKAFKQLEQLRRDGDIILIENDLPDIYEQKIRF
jgi:UDP-N-acetylmuramoyl-tripeptide--D-alanyl-D-alanine ligase